MTPDRARRDGLTFRPPAGAQPPEQLSGPGGPGVRAAGQLSGPWGGGAQSPEQPSAPGSLGAQRTNGRRTDGLPAPTGAELKRPDGLPGWWEPLLTRAASARTEDFTTMRPPASGGRPSAVLVLLGEERAGEPDLLVLQRAATMRNHAGQPAFPGGAADPEDRDPAATALREANEEVGLDPATATVLTTLPELYIPVSRFVVTPVLAWWHAPHPVHPRQAEEVAHVARLPIAELVDPANRIRVRHPSGWIGPAFQVRGMLVWGFTAGVISALLDMAGWSLPWRPGRIMELPDPAPLPRDPAPQPHDAAPLSDGPAPQPHDPAPLSDGPAPLPHGSVAGADATASAPTASDEVVS